MRRFAAIVLTLLAVTPVRGQSPDEKIEAYKKAHPLKASAVLDTALLWARTLGAESVAASASCETEPDLPGVGTDRMRLHENTKIALSEAYIEGVDSENDYVQRSADMCVFMTQHYWKGYRNKAEIIHVLRAHGY